MEPILKEKYSVKETYDRITQSIGCGARVYGTVGSVNVARSLTMSFWRFTEKLATIYGCIKVIT